MHRTLIRRVTTCAAATLTCVAIATPAAHADVDAGVATDNDADVATNYAEPDGIEVDNPADLLASVGDMSPGEVFATSVENTPSLTDPAGSLAMAWDGIRCFMTTPGIDGEDNCWF